MFGIIILYLLIGVTFNYLWDVTISFTGSEENRFTVKERLIVSMIWPVALGFGLATFIAALFKK
jgi:hypothetical protein